MLFRRYTFSVSLRKICTYIQWRKSDGKFEGEGDDTACGPKFESLIHIIGHDKTCDTIEDNLYNIRQKNERILCRLCNESPPYLGGGYDALPSPIRLFFGGACHPCPPRDLRHCIHCLSLTISLIMPTAKESNCIRACQSYSLHVWCISN